MSKRLRAARASLRRVAERGLREDRDAHALRVAARRAEAAIMLFMPVLPNAAAKSARRSLRDARRVVGTLRRADVHRDLIARSSACERALAYAGGRLDEERRRERAEARDRVAEALPAFESARSGLLRRVRRRCRRCGEGDLCFADLAAQRVQRGRRAVVAVGELAGDDLDGLHRLRLACKRLRYSAEAAKGGLEPRRRAALRRATELMQERLGEVNDLHELSLRLEGWLAEDAAEPAIAAGLSDLRASVNARLLDRLGAFAAWWGDARRRGSELGGDGADPERAAEIGGLLTPRGGPMIGQEPADAAGKSGAGGARRSGVSA